MESKNQTPSVILKLMGLDKLPPQQHYLQDKPKVLSDEYFQKVASIGVRKKRLSIQQYSDGMSTDEEKECEDVLKVAKTIRRDEHHNPSKGIGEENAYLYEAKVKGLLQQLMDVSYKSVHTKPKTLVDAVSSFNHETFRFSKSQLDLKAETFNSRSAVLKASPVQGRNGLNYVSLPSSCKNYRLASGMPREIFCAESMRVCPEMRGEKNIKDFGKQSSESYTKSSKEVSIQTGDASKRVLDTVSSSFSRRKGAFAQSSDMLNPASNVAVNEIQHNSPFFCSRGAYVGSELKNKTLEQRDATKKLQAVERHDQGNTRHQLLTISESSYYGARNINDQSCLSNDTIKMNTTCKVGARYSLARKLPMTRPLHSSSVTIGNRRSMAKDNFFAKYWGFRKNATPFWIIQKSKNQSVNQKESSEDLRPILDIHIEEDSFDLQKLKNGNDLSDKKTMLPQLSRFEPSTSFAEDQILQDTCLIIDESKMKNKHQDSSMHIVFPNSPVIGSKSDAKVEVVSRSHINATMQQSESTSIAWSQGDSDSSSHSSYASTQQDASELQDDSACSLSSGTEPDSLGSSGDAYGPSPVSVLNPLFREDISCSFKVVDADEYDLSETEDEELSLNVSSDEDCEDESVAGYDERKDLIGSFRSEESRDFSYVVEVLSEAGTLDKSLFTDFSTWHSPEGPISTSLFEVLEKKFGEQQFWKRSERRLLFDRINAGLSDILQPYSYIPTWEKPVSIRLNTQLRQDMIEEEMWGFLVAQEKKSGKDLEANMLGGEISWIELGENIEDIARDIVDFLIEKLANEIVSF